MKLRNSSDPGLVWLPEVTWERPSETSPCKYLQFSRSPSLVRPILWLDENPKGQLIYCVCLLYADRPYSCSCVRVAPGPVWGSAAISVINVVKSLVSRRRRRQNSSLFLGVDHFLNANKLKMQTLKCFWKREVAMPGVVKDLGLTNVEQKSE